MYHWYDLGLERTCFNETPHQKPSRCLLALIANRICGCTAAWLTTAPLNPCCPDPGKRQGRFASSNHACECEIDRHAKFSGLQTPRTSTITMRYGLPRMYFSLTALTWRFVGFTISLCMCECHRFTSYRLTSHRLQSHCKLHRFTVTHHGSPHAAILSTHLEGVGQPPTCGRLMCGQLRRCRAIQHRFRTRST